MGHLYKSLIFLFVFLIMDVTMEKIWFVLIGNIKILPLLLHLNIPRVLWCGSLAQL